MVSLYLRCPSLLSEFVIADLWEAGTVAISEKAIGNGTTELIAGFTHPDPSLLAHFARWDAVWQRDETDWLENSRTNWGVRLVGKRIALRPVWSRDPIPSGRVEIVHNPSMASGTGEHPCTQLALEALEDLVTADAHVADIGTGSGLLAITAMKLGAGDRGAAVDPDLTSLAIAHQNAGLNEVRLNLVAGSADALGSEMFDITVANMNGTVLLYLLEDLLRITKSGGHLILTGFPSSEARPFHKLLPNWKEIARDGWSCVWIW